MMAQRDYNSPAFSGRLVNADGTPTQAGYTFIRRLWERTGHARGTDGAYTAAQAQSTQEETDALGAQIGVASAAGACAQKAAEDALAAAQIALMQAESIRAEARKALEAAQDCAIIGITTGANRAGNPDTDGMIFAIMNS